MKRLYRDTGLSQARNLGSPAAEEPGRIIGPRVLESPDRLQVGASSQARRIEPRGSSSWWRPSTLAVTGLAEERDGRRSRTELVRAFDGVVQEVKNDTFVVRIVPTDGHGIEEEAEFLVADIPESDRPMLRRGAPLYWFIGYETEGRRRRRTSELKLRRLPPPAPPSAGWLAGVLSMVASPDASEPTEG